VLELEKVRAKIEVALVDGLGLADEFVDRADVVRRRVTDGITGWCGHRLRHRISE